MAQGAPSGVAIALRQRLMSLADPGQELSGRGVHDAGPSDSRFQQDPAFRLMANRSDAIARGPE